MDDKTAPQPPPAPVQKTAAVPLKKETVRITLRARPGAGLTQPKEMTAPVPPPTITSPVPRPITTSVTPAGASTGRVPTAPAPISPVPLSKTTVAPVSKATAPIQLPSAPLPPPAARPATAPVQLPPGAPAAARTTTYVKLDSPPGGPPGPPRPGGPMAPTVPLAKAPGPPRPGGAPAPPRPGGGGAMAPTVPLSKAPGPPRPPGAKVEAGASTVPLSKAPVVVPKAPGSGTAPMAKTGGPTQNLPKATVQLAKSPSTQALGKGGIATPPSAPAKRAGEESAPMEEERDPEAGLAPLAIVCTVLALALMALNIFGSDRAFSADIGSDSPFMVPIAPHTPWETKNDDGTYTSNFTSQLKEITNKFGD
jgi:hypothetical protein